MSAIAIAHRDTMVRRYISEWLDQVEAAGAEPSLRALRMHADQDASSPSKPTPDWDALFYELVDARREAQHG